MKDYLHNLPKDISDLLCLASKIADKRKVYIYLVGGFVRDLILGVPNFDLDIVIQGDGIDFAVEFARRLGALLVTHPRFGTATLTTPKKIKVDITTARSETYPAPACLPVVAPGTIRDDLARRDFTINALAVDLLSKNFGSLVDFNQGKKDLKAKAIRVLHDVSFIDDPTRIFRAIRFEQRLGFNIEAHTLQLLKQSVKQRLLQQVSSHRLMEEIKLLFREPCCLKNIVRIQELVGFSFIHPKIKLTKTRLNFLSAINSEINWFHEEFPKHRALDIWLMYFIGISDRLTRKDINDICKEFSLQAVQTKKSISYNAFSKAKVTQLSKKSIPASGVYKILNESSHEVLLLIKARYGNETLRLNIEDFLKHYSSIRHYVSGKDLLKLGIKPSVAYKHILDQVVGMQLDGKIKSKRQALKWVREHK